MSFFDKEIKKETRQTSSTKLRTNIIYCGDCLFVMRHDIPPNSIDLIYLDPPFFTGRVQKGSVWSPEAMEISYDDSKKFWESKRYVGAPEYIINIGFKRYEFASYLEYMRKRLEACKRVLKDTGSIYLHCDYRASHYLKMVMDDVFGVDNFQNEIIWGYRTGGLSVRRFPWKHDTILFYSKSNDYKFHALKERIYYEKPFFRNTQDKNGRYYADVYVRDVWDDTLKPVINVSKERVGYPTQKPEALLERIITASSDSMDIVLDPFCGCGTAIVSAHKLGRRWIGIDINPQASEVMKKRFAKHSVTLEICWRDIGQIKKLEPKQFEGWVNDFYNADKPSPDLGVDGITPEGIPIQTKTFTVRYNVVDAFFNSARYHPKVPKPVKKAIVVSQTGFDYTATSRAIEIEKKEGVKITLLTPEDMLGEVNV